MAHVAATSWVQQMAALTVAPAAAWPDDEVTTATTAAALLAAFARDVCHLPSAAPGPDLLARQLAGLNPGDMEISVPAAGPTQRLERYHVALREAGFAVYVCRRVLHPAGSCLFRPVGYPDDDLCGRVLAAAHHHAAEHQAG